MHLSTVGSVFATNISKAKEARNLWYSWKTQLPHKHQRLVNAAVESPLLEVPPPCAKSLDLPSDTRHSYSSDCITSGSGLASMEMMGWGNWTWLLLLLQENFSESKRLEGYLFWHSSQTMLSASRKKTTCGLAREKVTSICTQVSSKLSFLQTLTKPVSCALSEEFHKVTAGDHIPPWPTNTPICLFLLPSEQLWPLSLPAQVGTKSAPPCWYCCNYQARFWVSSLYWCQCHCTSSPALLCTALF